MSLVFGWCPDDCNIRMACDGRHQGFQIGAVSLVASQFDRRVALVQGVLHLGPEPLDEGILLVDSLDMCRTHPELVVEHWGLHDANCRACDMGITFACDLSGEIKRAGICASAGDTYDNVFKLHYVFLRI
ncbi:MAG: hypothetical protein Q8L84_05025 [Hyphomonas sp.]|nr:hypothetical protein [Hyphomonas sp.]